MFNFNIFKQKCKFWYKKYQYRNKYVREIYRELLREEFNLFKKDKHIEQYYELERDWLAAGFDLNKYIDKIYNIFIERKFRDICDKLGYQYPDMSEHDDYYMQKNQITIFKPGVVAPSLFMYTLKGENPYEEVYLNFAGFVTK